MQHDVWMAWTEDNYDASLACVPFDRGHNHKLASEQNYRNMAVTYLVETAFWVVANLLGAKALTALRLRRRARNVRNGAMVMILCCVVYEVGDRACLLCLMESTS